MFGFNILSMLLHCRKTTSQTKPNLENGYRYSNTADHEMLPPFSSIKQFVDDMVQTKIY
jgi:hypothetical protein